jgi:valyl-tRNA synthetase
VYAAAADVLSEVRKAKTQAQRSLRTEAERVVVRDTAERLAALRAALDDVSDAARARTVDLATADGFSVEVELAASDAA